MNENEILVRKLNVPTPNQQSPVSDFDNFTVAKEAAEQREQKLAEVREEYVAVVGDEGARWTDRHNEARKKYTEALATALFTEARVAQSEARSRFGEDFENDRGYQEELSRLYTTYVTEVQGAVGEQDPSFDATVSILSDPELFALFSTRMNEEKARGPAGLIFEGMNTSVLSGLENIAGKELLALLYTSRQKYFCARVADMAGFPPSGAAALQQGYKLLRNTLKQKVNEYILGERLPEQERIVDTWRKLLACDVMLEKEITRYALMPEKQRQVVPTAVRMKKIKAPWWKAMALAIAAFAGLTGDTHNVGEGPRRPAHEDAFGNKDEKPGPVAEETAPVEVEVSTRARRHGAIETFQWFLYDMDARGFHKERDALIRGVLGETALSDTQPIQSLLLAQRLGFTATAPEELLTDADFNANADMKGPILLDYAQFVFDPASGTLRVKYDDDRRRSQVLVERNAEGNYVQTAHYRQ